MVGTTYHIHFCHSLSRQGIDSTWLFARLAYWCPSDQDRQTHRVHLWYQDRYPSPKQVQSAHVVLYETSTQLTRPRTFAAAEVNFLCVHKKLRSKRLAPVLIKEVTRRVNLQNVWQAIYTGGVVLPTPIGTSRYYHRNLNPQKLVDIGFSAQPRSMTMARMKKHYSVGTVPKIPGFRELTKADIPQVRELLTRYLDRFDVAQLFTKDEEVEHWFLLSQGREVDGKRVKQVVWAYVVEVRSYVSHGVAPAPKAVDWADLNRTPQRT